MAMRERISSVRSGVEAFVSRVEIDMRERFIDECSDTPSGEISGAPLAVHSAVADGRLAVAPDCTASLVEVVESAAKGFQGTLRVFEERLKEQAELNRELRSILDDRSGGGVTVPAAFAVRDGAGAPPPVESPPSWSAMVARSGGVVRGSRERGPVSSCGGAMSPLSRPEVRPAPRRVEDSGLLVDPCPCGNFENGWT